VSKAIGKPAAALCCEDVIKHCRQAPQIRNIIVEAKIKTPPSQILMDAVPTSSERLYSLDTYRGLTMMLLAFTVPYYDWASNIATSYPDSSLVGKFLAQFDHIAWQGLVLWDMIQPSFMFMVGVSLVYSCNSRLRRGHSFTRLLVHAIYRSLFLILLGVFLRSLNAETTYWTFEDVVTQIGLGYVPLFLLWWYGWRTQVAAFVAILIGMWLVFALWPVDPSNPNPYTGFFAHWNITGNPAQYIDQWFLNLFPRETTFVANEGGYYTFNFVPSLATMILGLLAGNTLHAESAASSKIKRLSLAGLALVFGGILLQITGICPIVKKIWTPSFVLLSGGLCLGTLAALYYLVDVKQWQRLSFPARIVGMNSMAVYIMVYTLAGWLAKNLQTHLGTKLFSLSGNAYEHLLLNLSVGACLWLICYWMYKRQLFLRI
jgi:predicted acyltransferase